MARPYTGSGALPPNAMASDREAPEAARPPGEARFGALPPRPGNGSFHFAEPKVKAVTPIVRGAPAGAASRRVPTVPGR
jgi:hypothetical protein